MPKRSHATVKTGVEAVIDFYQCTIMCKVKLLDEFIVPIDVYCSLLHDIARHYDQDRL